MFERTRQLLQADLGEELLGLDIDTGTCFGFNEVAASVWRRLETPKSFAELRDALLDEFQVSRVQCSDELAELLQTLTERGLVRTP